MLTDSQFKGLCTGRLAYVEHPEIKGYQLFGVVFLEFKHEIYATQRVQLVSLAQKAKEDATVFCFTLVFPDEVEFSGIDMNTFKELYLALLEYNSQLAIVCGPRGVQKIKNFSRTASIPTFNSISETLMNIKPLFLKAFENKITRNILIYDSDSQQRDSIVNLLLIDRFSTLGIQDYTETLNFVTQLGKFIDGFILELKYPTFQEATLIEIYRQAKPDGKILIFADVLDPSLLGICQKHKITSVLKSPFKPINMIRKFKTEFPERESNFLGFTE